MMFCPMPSGSDLRRMGHGVLDMVRTASPSWMPRLTAGLTLLLMVSFILGDEVFFGFIPHAAAVHFVTVSLVLRLLFFVLLLWVVVEGIRSRESRAGWCCLPSCCGDRAFTRELSLIHIRLNWFRSASSSAFQFCRACWWQWSSPCCCCDGC